MSPKRGLATTRRFFTRILEHGPRPTEVTTDRLPAYPRIKIDPRHWLPDRLTELALAI